MKPINPSPPSLTVVPDSPAVTLTESPPAPPEQPSIPPVFKDTSYMAMLHDGDWFLLIEDKDGPRHLSESEAQQVASMMNEQGSNIVTLYCRTDKCSYKGSWLKRASGDVKKNVYFCEGCKQAMIR